jgi:hypothetical protein
MLTARSSSLVVHYEIGNECYTYNGVESIVMKLN